VAGPDGPARPVGGLAVRPPAGVELQPAGRDDLVTVLRLLGERESLAPPLSSQAARDRWERIIGSVDASPFLAIAEGEAAGLLLLVFRRRLNFATWEGWVPELVVARTFRGRGIGRALLRVAIEEWRLRGAHRLSVETEPMEDGCAAMLTGLGFEEGLLRFRHDRIAAAVSKEWQAWLINTLYWIIPKTAELGEAVVAYVSGNQVPDRVAAALSPMPFLTTAAFGIVCLALASWLFQRKEF